MAFNSRLRIPLAYNIAPTFSKIDYSLQHLPCTLSSDLLFSDQDWLVIIMKFVSIISRELNYYIYDLVVKLLFIKKKF